MIKVLSSNLKNKCEIDANFSLIKLDMKKKNEKKRNICKFGAVTKIQTIKIAITILLSG